MRRLALVLPILALAAPASAQFGPARDRTPPSAPARQDADAPDAPVDEPAASEDGGQGELGRVADRVSDPRTGEAVADAVVALADAVLDIRIDRIRDAVAQTGDRGYDRGHDRDGGRGRERTLGDIIARDDPYFRERVREDAARAAAGAGAAVRTAQRAEPELRRIAEEFGRRVEEAIGRAVADDGR